MENQTKTGNVIIDTLMKKQYRKINDIDFENLMNHIAEDMNWANAQPSILTNQGTIEQYNLQKFAKVIHLTTMPSQSNTPEIKRVLNEYFGEDVHFTIRRGVEQSRLAFNHDYFICFLITKK